MQRAGLQVMHRRVESEESYVLGLREFAPDVILSDFSMPGFDGMRALELARVLAPWTPFLFVSGTLGEESAIRALRGGATDYVLKNNLARLPPAIERALAEAKVRRARHSAEAGLARAQRVARLAHVITGPGGTFETWSDSFPELVGRDSDAFPKTAREWLYLLHPQDREHFRARSLEAAATGRRVDIDYRLLKGDAEWIHIHQVIEPLSAPEVPAGERWFNTIQDVTEQKRAESHIQRLNRVYAVLSTINSLIVRARSREELFSGACRIAVEDGKFPLAWIGLLNKAENRLEVVASGGDAPDYLGSMPLGAGPDTKGLGPLAMRERTAVVANDIATDGRVALRREALAHGFHALVALPLVVKGEAVGVMMLYSDQAGFFDSEEMKLLNELAGDISFAIDHIGQAERLEYLSYYDPLTGLANRMLLMDRLAQAVASSAEGEKLVLALLDIQRFKTINDTLGRQDGDVLLTRIAGRLVSLTGDPSRVARIGADRFAVIIPGVRKEESLARAIDDGFAKLEGEPFRVGGTELRLAMKCGIALFPGDGADADSLFRNAEAALKKAKESGDKYLFYTQQMTSRVAERLSLENKLRSAVEREEFVLHYQPKLRMADRAIVGVEALIRWQSAEGEIAPEHFIPLLEETGLIMQVGSWALRRAVADHRGLVGRGFEAPRIAVNVSPIQLRRASFLDTVRQVLAEGTDPPGIDLEITESVIMEDIAGNIGRLSAMRELGMHIAIDDFGTGYSSLGYLAKLPVHSLKIDRSFIVTMEKDANALTLVSTIISLAHSLGLKVIAEGVETEGQAHLLKLLHCDEMQGYLYSKALPLEDVAKLLQRPR
jgi:diguanylate cyclase (GGDEF)-like protein